MATPAQHDGQERSAGAVRRAEGSGWQPEVKGRVVTEGDDRAGGVGQARPQRGTDRPSWAGGGPAEEAPGRTLQLADGCIRVGRGLLQDQGIVGEVIRGAGGGATVPGLT